MILFYYSIWHTHATVLIHSQSILLYHDDTSKLFAAWIVFCIIVCVRVILQCLGMYMCLCADADVLAFSRPFIASNQLQALWKDMRYVLLLQEDLMGRFVLVEILNMKVKIVQVWQNVLHFNLCVVVQIIISVDFRQKDKCTTRTHHIQQSFTKIIWAIFPCHAVPL